MNVVLDTCVVRDIVVNKLYHYLRNTCIMKFQLDQLTVHERDLFFKHEGRVLHIAARDVRYDDNFCLLNIKKHMISTYDKKLKRVLKRKGFKVVHGYKCL